jgi:hypothetical protein
MEYYLAVRMRRFGRAFQPSESTNERPSDRQLGQATAGRPMHGITPRLGSAAGMTGTVRPMAAPPRSAADPRPLGRPLGRLPGRD